MDPRNSFFVVFFICAISFSIEARPSNSPSPATDNHDNQRQNEIENDNRVNQTAYYKGVNKNGGHAGRPYGNDIMMRKPKIKDMDKALKYMYKYGYMPVPNHPTHKTPEMSPDHMKRNIKKMQMMMGVPITGELDGITMAMIDVPRCGVHDPVHAMVIPDDGIFQIEPSPQNFVHFGQKWPRNNITFRILNFPRTLNRNDAYTSIQEAFKLWSDVTPLTFTEKVAGYADIYLKFGRNEHGDIYPFDGEGGVLAHAFLPQSFQGDLEGDVHFDDDEEFTRRSVQGTNLFYVAAHEIGHALGLHHSANPSALMAPFINPYNPEFTLHPDDIAGIQDLYGAPSTTKTTVNPVTQSRTTLTRSTTTDHVTTSSPPTKISSFTQAKTTSIASTPHPDRTVSLTTETDATSRTASSPVDPDISSQISSSYTFFDSSSSSVSSLDYFASDTEERCPPYHSFFDDDNGGVTLDAANENDDCDFTFDAVASYRGEIFAFKNDRYWRFTRDAGLISPLNGAQADYFFESFPGNIDAAYEQYLTSKLLVFKGNNFYVYNGITLESGPHPITNLDPTLPSDLDAVLTWGEWHKTYFFKDDLVWRYDERYGSVDEGWPWLIKDIWTGVPNNLNFAFRWGDYTNFVRGNRLYAYDDYCYYVNPRDNPKSFSQEFIGSTCPHLG